VRSQLQELQPKNVSNLRYAFDTKSGLLQSSNVNYKKTRRRRAREQDAGGKKKNLSSETPRFLPTSQELGFTIRETDGKNESREGVKEKDKTFPTVESVFSEPHRGLRWEMCSKQLNQRADGARSGRG